MKRTHGLLIVGLILTAILAGCTQSGGGVRAALMQNDRMASFLQDHEDANVSAATWSPTRFSTADTDINDNCLTSINQSKTHYRVEVVTPNETVIAWVQQSPQEVRCVRGVGFDLPEPSNGESEDSEQGNDDEGDEDERGDTEKPENVGACQGTNISLHQATYFEANSTLVLNLSTDLPSGDTVGATINRTDSLPATYSLNLTEDQSKSTLQIPKVTSSATAELQSTMCENTSSNEIEVSVEEEDIGSSGSEQIACSFGGLAIYDAVYFVKEDSMAVAVANTGTRDLSDGVIVELDYSNGTVRRHNVTGLNTGEVDTTRFEDLSISGVDELSEVYTASKGCPELTDRVTEFEVHADE